MKGDRTLDYTKMSDLEIAASILNESKVPMYYKDLITEVIEKSGKSVHAMAEAISEIYTQINMDSKFHYAGEGKWGLTEWNPPETKRSARAARSAAATRAQNNRQREENLFESIQEGN